MKIKKSDDENFMMKIKRHIFKRSSVCCVKVDGRGWERKQKEWRLLQPPGEREEGSLHEGGSSELGRRERIRICLEVNETCPWITSGN